ncbi:blue copper protein-like [Aristolochia californica]|uniref:blue copper protein-like n=1 Tax=Aristolochia californica TaxID=171875 RepID=UPI0035DB7888
MASMKMFSLLVVVIAILVVLSNFSMAKEFIVGDEAGWNVNFDKNWVEGKDFIVGDTIVFKYNKSKHNVYKVDKAGFDNCTVPPNGLLNTGNDTIALASPGKKWYICGVGEHCAKLGMKLALTVKAHDDSAAAPSSPPATPGGPSSSNSASGIVASGFQALHRLNCFCRPESATREMILKPVARMGSKQMLVFLLITMACLPAISLAKEFVVGDESGWRTDFNYTAWAEGKDFHVGDALVFNYPKRSHNVLRVDGVAFQSCTAPQDITPLETGNDVITLQSPGRRWYICGVAQHCELGMMKLVITVQEKPGFSLHDNIAPTPAMPGGETPSSANGIERSAVQVLLVAMAAVVMMFMA